MYSASRQAKTGITLPTRFFSIANQLKYGIVVLVVVALVLTSWSLINLSFQAQIQQVKVIQQERSKAAAGDINEYLNDLQRKLSYLARVQGLTNLSPEIQRKFLQALIRHNSAYETVAILNNNGFVVSSVLPYEQETLTNQVAYSSFIRAFKQKEDFVSSVEIDSATKLPLVTLAVPIRNQQDEIDGVLLAQVNLKFLWFFVSKANVGKSGYAYVIDNRKFLIAQKESVPENFKLKDLSDRPFIQNLTKLNPTKPLTTYRGLKGVEVVGGIAPIHSMHWKVVVELPTAEAYAPVRNMLFVMCGALSLATVVAAFLGIFFSRQIVLPLQRLTQAAAQISAGNLDTQVQVTRCNELGLLAITFNEMTQWLRESIKELRKERNFVSLVLDTAGALVFVLDRGGRIIRFNRACEYLTGYSAREVEGRYLWDLFVPPEEVLAVRAIFPELRAHLFPNQYEKYLVVRDGSRRLIAWSNTVLVDSDGSIKYIISTGIDITQRKQAEEALLLSEEKFSKAFNSSPDSIAITTLNQGRFIDVNKSFLTITGYNREELIGHTTLELNNWVNLADRDRIIHMLQAEGGIANQEVEFRKKSGEVLVGLFSAEIINIGGEPCLLTVTIDITERKFFEAQLRTTAKRDRLLAEIALRIQQSLNLEQILSTAVTEVRQFLQADRVYIGHIVGIGKMGTPYGEVVAESVDLKWPSMRGWKFEDETHLSEAKTLFERRRVRVVDDTTQVEVSPAIAQHYIQHQVKASLAVPITLGEELYGVLVANQCSSPRHWQQFEIELLEQLATQVTIAIQQAELYHQIQALNTGLERQVEERTAQLQQKMQELQELYKMKDVFLHAFSHDLRNPIVGTSLVLKNLLNSPSDPVTVSRSVLERIVEGSDRQLNLINSLLEAHKSELQGIVLHCEAVQLSQLIQSIVEDLEPLIAKSEATLTNLVSAELPVISADPTQLGRVFENLIGNALKYNLPGVSITIKATKEEGMIRCTIEDNGVGMSPEQLRSLFELYVRGSHARYSTGLGLGLYLCRQIVTAHGGEIGVTSHLGSGATFWFTLPLPYTK